MNNYFKIDIAANVTVINDKQLLSSVDELGSDCESVAVNKLKLAIDNIGKIKLRWRTDTITQVKAMYLSTYLLNLLNGIDLAKSDIRTDTLNKKLVDKLGNKLATIEQVGLYFVIPKKTVLFEKYSVNSVVKKNPYCPWYLFIGFLVI